MDAVSINEYVLRMLSMDGKSFIRTFDLSFFQSIRLKLWSPCYFGVKDDGQMFVADCFGQRVFWFNSKFTDYRTIIDPGKDLFESQTPIVFIKEKQQMLVCGPWTDLRAVDVSVHHLSPCSLSRHQQESM